MAQKNTSGSKSGEQSTASPPLPYAKLAHDIRNALAVISMEAETQLMEDSLDRSLKEAFNRILTEADRINTML